MSISRLFQRARELERQRREIIHLEVGQLDLPISKVIKGLTPKAYSPYVDINGIGQLRESISEYCSNVQGIDVSPNEILVTPGGRFAIYATMVGCLGSNDAALVLDPSWPGYIECAEVARVKLQRVPTFLENGWVPDLTALEARIKSAKLLILNYPNNPTGKILDEDVFEAVQDMARKYKVLLLRDEAYVDYNFRGDKLPPLDLSNSVSVFTFSKSFAMAGFRLGFTIADAKTISRLSKVHSAVMTCVNEYSQRAGIIALRDKTILKRNANILRKRIAIAASLLKDFGLSFYYPEGGMYLFARVETKAFDSLKFANHILEQDGVALVPGAAFGPYPEFLRISLGTSTPKIIRGLKILGKALE
ncbi:MAG: pyridoxal phosphate-dependent aminotransferase [Nitrososphaerales archaeon]